MAFDTRDAGTLGLIIIASAPSPSSANVSCSPSAFAPPLQAAWDAGAGWRPWAAQHDPIGCIELDLVWEGVNLPFTHESAAAAPLSGGGGQDDATYGRGRERQQQRVQGQGQVQGQGHGKGKVASSDRAAGVQEGSHPSWDAEWDTDWAAPGPTRVSKEQPPSSSPFATAATTAATAATAPPGAAGTSAGGAPLPPAPALSPSPSVRSNLNSRCPTPAAAAAAASWLPLLPPSRAQHWSLHVLQTPGLSQQYNRFLGLRALDRYRQYVELPSSGM